MLTKEYLRNSALLRVQFCDHRFVAPDAAFQTCNRAKLFEVHCCRCKMKERRAGEQIQQTGSGVAPHAGLFIHALS